MSAEWILNFNYVIWPDKLLSSNLCKTDKCAANDMVNTNLQYYRILMAVKSRNCQVWTTQSNTGTVFLIL